MHHRSAQSSHAPVHTLSIFPSMSPHTLSIFPSMRHHQASTVWSLQVYSPSHHLYITAIHQPRTHSCHTPHSLWIHSCHQALSHQASPDSTDRTHLAVCITGSGAYWPLILCPFPRRSEPPPQGLCIHCNSTQKAFPLHLHVPTSHSAPSVQMPP